MNPLKKNEETGFLESSNPSSSSFDSYKKTIAVQLAVDAVKQKQLPHISDICDMIGVNETTFYRHLREDRAFAEAWQRVRIRIDSTWGKELSDKANRPNGTLACLAILRKNETGSWSGEYRLNQQTDAPGIKGINQQFPEIIDAEIVPEKEDK